jgi:magnesium-transporting ATPase (P-type)
MSGGRIPLALTVLQILALDIGTDTLSAVALGAERPGPDVLSRPPVTGRLLNRTVLSRAFGILGPTVATATMVAFFVSFAAFGWRPGDAFPEAHVAAAAGAAFITMVFAQTANAFACRSATRWPGALGWTTNRLLIVGASVELVFSFVVLFVAPIADELGHAPPPASGWMVAAASVVALLAVDAFVKHRHAVQTRERPTAATPRLAS